MRGFLALGLIAAATQGCALLPKYWGAEKGHVWCNSRYMDTITEFASPSYNPDAKEVSLRYRIANAGYIYALAGTLVLQDNRLEGPYTFDPTPHIEHLKDQDEGSPRSGFFASTYVHELGNGQLPEIIVAFRGTNDSRDWLLHNVAPIAEQYPLARLYLKLAAARNPQRSRIVVTGFSLGAGLAAHVTHHKDTSTLVDEAWLFNPSPRDGIKSPENNKIWFASNKGEILSWLRINSLGAPKSHASNAFNLIDSSNVYGHSRFVLTRQMLHLADLYQFVKGGRVGDTTEPLLILGNSDDSRCDPKYEEQTLEARRKLQETKTIQAGSH